MENQLLFAYLRATYKIFNPQITIKVGSNNKELDALLEKYGSTNWAFITSANPNSERLADIDNDARYKELLYMIEDTKVIIHEGESYGKNWASERSVLLIDIPENDIVKIAQHFGQNAILIGEKGSNARILWLAQ